MKSLALLPAAALGALALIGCKPTNSGSGSATGGSSIEYPLTAGKFTILGLRTDETDKSRAKQNAESTLLKHEDVDALVGLWAYNAPQCLEAAKDAGKAGKVKIFSFDEDEATLQGIKDGLIEGTIVQDPYEFGYQSMKYLKMIADGKEGEIELPDNKQIDIPAREINQENVDPFWAQLKERRAAGEEAANQPTPENGPRFAFVINTPDPFWSYARAGCAKAQQDFGIICQFETPSDGSVTEQNRILENILQQGVCQGVAITPLEPANQTDIINQVADAMPLICHDSDAPESKRRFYLGTNNVEAGRMLGKLIKKRMPEGGKIMVFVGKIDVLNAQQRRDGLIEELSKP